MAKKTKTIEERLKNLFDLQMIDSKIDQIKILKGALPIEVKDLEDEIAGLETRVNKLNSVLEDVKNHIGKHKENIKTSESLIERYNKQLDEVKNNREFEALTKEIELQNLEIQLSEKRIREANDDNESKAEALAQTAERKAQKEEDLVKKKEELEKIIEKTEKEEKTLSNKSDKAQAKIEERMLKYYHKTRAAYRNGLAVVTYGRGSCGGCFNRIPPQLQIEIGNRKELITCEHCGRVLVDHEIAGITEDVD
jgi:predicted  nucleic acid-binding Zn-ribbon protein